MLPLQAISEMPGFELIGEEERNEVNDVFDNGRGILFRHGFEGIRNNSYKVKEFENSFAEHMCAPYSLAVSSGTAALRVALAALEIKRGDEVITQSFTFVATAEAIIEAGATPVCVDIDSTLNMDPSSLRKAINEKTKAVIVVHMLGTPARLREISEICQEKNIRLIEDTAWGCGGSLSGKYLGTWGDIGTFSFDFAKTITTGEGGMILFKDYHLFARAAAWHDHGHENNPLYPRWEDTRSSSGFNFRMMELQAAVGLAQLRKLDKIVSLQRENHALIWDKLRDLPEIQLRSEPEGSISTADALVLLLKSPLHARICRDELLKKGLSTKILPEAYTWHFAETWSHMPELKHYSASGSSTPTYSQSRDILQRALSIPISTKLSPNTPADIRECISKGLSIANHKVEQ